MGDGVVACSRPFLFASLLRDCCWCDALAVLQLHTVICFTDLAVSFWCTMAESICCLCVRIAHVHVLSNLLVSLEYFHSALGFTISFQNVCWMVYFAKICL